MLYTLLYVIPFILLFLLIIAWVPWRGIFDKLWGNNPFKARVYVEAGEQTTICKGRLQADSPAGLVYAYKYFKRDLSVLVKYNYPYRYILGWRKIRVIAGQGVAAPLEGMAPETCIVSASTLNAVIEAHIGTELARTIFGKTLNIMMIIIMVAGIGLVGYFFMKQFMAPSPGTVQPPAQEQQLTPEQQREFIEKKMLEESQK